MVAPIKVELKAMRFYTLVAILGAISMIGIYASYITLTRGHVVTALSDRMMWGLWITGYISWIALDSGGFLIAAAYHLFKIKKFAPIVRLAVLVSLLACVIGVFNLILDLKPDRFYYVFLFVNPGSVLFGVILCIVLYTLILVVEIAPAILEGVKKPSAIVSFIERVKLIERLHRLAPALAVIGLGFSVLHHTLLGGVFGVIGARPATFGATTLPLIFISSACAGGLALVSLVGIIASKATGREIASMDVLSDIAKISAAFLAGYLVMLSWHIYWVNYYRVAPFTFWFWGILQLAFACVAFILFLYPKTRKNRVWFFLAAFLAVSTVVVNRWDATVNTTPVISLSEPVTYFPTWVEWSLTIGLIGLWALLLTLSIHFLPILSKASEGT